MYMQVKNYDELVIKIGSFTQHFLPTNISREKEKHVSNEIMNFKIIGKV